MDINTFISNVAEQFENTDSAQITPATEFKAIEEWSSLIALSIIAMVDSEYEVRIKGEDIRSSRTVEDLFNLVKSRV